MTTTTETELPATLESTRPARWPRSSWRSCSGIGLALAPGRRRRLRLRAGPRRQGRIRGPCRHGRPVRPDPRAGCGQADRRVCLDRRRPADPRPCPTARRRSATRISAGASTSTRWSTPPWRSVGPATRWPASTDEIRTAIRGTTVAPVVTFDQTALEGQPDQASPPRSPPARRRLDPQLGRRATWPRRRLTAGACRSTRSPAR